MPLYSYHCAKCNTNFELLVGMSEKAACPTCNSRRLERLFWRVEKKPGKGRAVAKATQSKRRANAAPASAKTKAKAPAKAKKRRASRS